MLYNSQNNLHFWKSVGQAASLSGRQSSILGPFCLYLFFFQCFKSAQWLLFSIYFTRCLEQVSSLWGCGCKTVFNSLVKPLMTNMIVKVFSLSFLPSRFSCEIVLWTLGAHLYNSVIYLSTFLGFTRTIAQNQTRLHNRKNVVKQKKIPHEQGG